MSTSTWQTDDDDWTDPSAWSGGVVPGLNDIASFQDITATTFGYGAVGTISVDLANVTFLDGYFQTDPNGVSLVDQSNGLDGSGAGAAYNTLTVGAASFLSSGLLSLGDTDLSDQGGLLATGGDLLSLEVSGSEGFATFTGTLSTMSLAVTDGGSVSGNILMGNSSVLSLDDVSSLSQGTIETQGNVLFALVPTEVDGPSTVTLADGLQLDAGSTLSVLGPQNCTLALSGVIAGPGTLALEGVSLAIDAGASISSEIIETSTPLVGGTGGSAGTTTSSSVAIAVGGVFNCGELSLAQTTITDEGAFNAQGGTLQGLSVSGAGATASVSGTLGVATLSITTGGTLSGSIGLDDGGALSIDNSSAVSGGTIAVSGIAEVNLLPPSIGGGSDALLGDSIYLEAGTTLTIAGSPDAGLELAKPVVGQGNLVIDGTNVTLLGGLYIGTVSLVSSGTLTILSPSESTTTLPQAQSSMISCGSGSDDINDSSIPVSVTGSGAQEIRFKGGSGSAVLNADSATLIATLGSGPSTVLGGTSGLDSILCGQGPSVIVAKAGALVNVVGPGATEVSTLTGSETINGALSSGSQTYLCGGPGTYDSITSGSGSCYVEGGGGALQLQCGNGAVTVWAAGGADTIVGGDGNDILVAGANAVVKVVGPGHDTVIAGGDGGTYNLTAGTAETDFWGGPGSGTTTVLGGAGLDVIVGGSAPLNISGGNGNLSIWPMVDETVNVDISGGENTIAASAGSSIRVSGGGENHFFIIPGQGNDLVDCTVSSGNNTVFGGNVGVNTVYGGAGSDLIVGGATPLDVVCGSGNESVWDSSNGHSTIVGTVGNDTIAAFDDTMANISSAGNNLLCAFGSNTTLIGGGGRNIFWVASNAENTDVIAQGGNNAVFGGSGSLSLAIVGGSTVLYSGTGREVITVNPSDVGGQLNIYSYASSQCVLIDAHTQNEIIVPANSSSWIDGNFVLQDGAVTITLHNYNPF